MKLKTNLANWLLNRKAAKVSRNVRVHNLDSAKLIGVLWSFDEKNAFQTIHDYFKHKNVKLKSLHFSNGMDAQMVEENSFGKDQTNWLGFPKEAFIHEFTDQKFDILIDLSVTKKLPMVIVLALSKSAFKVGFTNDIKNYYDLNIDIHQKPDSDYLAEQILIYLNNINKTS